MSNLKKKAQLLSKLYYSFARWKIWGRFMKNYRFSPLSCEYYPFPLTKIRWPLSVEEAGSGKKSFFLPPWRFTFHPPSRLLDVHSSNVFCWKVLSLFQWRFVPLAIGLLTVRDPKNTLPSRSARPPQITSSPSPVRWNRCVCFLHRHQPVVLP